VQPSFARGNSFVSRRRFLHRSALAAATVQVVPAAVLGLHGATPPSERLNLAGIGVAGQGAQDLNQFKEHNLVALCDVDWAHAAGTFKQFPRAQKFKDYRKMLDAVKEIDAVIVATPDHHHAFATLAALRLGKHVYCEKPLTHSVWEARRVAGAAREAKVATQMGNQGQASEEARRLAEMISDGAIGPVREVHVWTDRPSNGLFKEYWPQAVARPAETPPVPETTEWDLWLGPAPARPYHPAYAPFKWRGWWDFGTGALGDIGCHTFAPIFRALSLGPPLTVQASSTRVNEETYPLASMVTYEFAARGAAPPVRLIWHDGGLRPARPPELEDGQRMPDTGAMLVGDRGRILTQNVGGRMPGYRLIPEARQREYGDPPRRLARSPGHYQEWIDACKGGAPAGSDFSFAGPLTEAVLLGNVALRLGLREEMASTKLRWDPAAFRFTNSEVANRFLRREYRPGWSLA
jgi:predicted dehydrogenase